MGWGCWACLALPWGHPGGPGCDSEFVSRLTWGLGERGQFPLILGSDSGTSGGQGGGRDLPVSLLAKAQESGETGSGEAPPPSAPASLCSAI